MSRAKIRKYKFSSIEEIIEKIHDKELKQIAYMYFVEKLSQIDISFELNYSERTINRRIKEIRTRFFA